MPEADNPKLDAAVLEQHRGSTCASSSSGFIPQLTVISPNDIPPNLQIVSLGVVGQ